MGIFQRLSGGVSHRVSHLENNFLFLFLSRMCYVCAAKIGSVIVEIAMYNNVLLCIFNT
jgi:hypothetical protein